MSDQHVAEERRAQERERRARAIEERLSPAMAVLGILFLLVVVGQALAMPGSGVQRTFALLIWVLWALFVLEFLVRLVIAPSAAAYLRRNWWQVLLLAIPVLNFVRLLLVARLARMGRLVSSALRGTRSARSRLGGRLGWLVAVHVLVVLSVSELAFQLLPFETFGAALYAVAMTSVSGESLGIDRALAQVLDVVLATYAVVVFGALAGVLGSFFLERRDEQERPDGEPRAALPA